MGMDKNVLENIWNSGFYFSVLSLFCSLIIFLTIVFNKVLKSFTFNILKWVFLSEILNSIGNIVGYFTNSVISLFLITFSDALTMSFLSFVAFCSVELIKKAKRDIKNKIKKFIIILSISSFIYGLLIIGIPFVIYGNTPIPKSFYFYSDNNIPFPQIVHIILLFGLFIYMSIKTCQVLSFMKEKEKIDKINSPKIAKLIKILFRFPLICMLYFILYIPSIILYKKDSDNIISYAITLFCVSFLSLRGFLLFLNTLQTNKVQMLIQRFLEVNIKHYLLLSFDLNCCLKDKNEERMKIVYEQFN